MQSNLHILIAASILSLLSPLLAELSAFLSEIMPFHLSVLRDGASVVPPVQPPGLCTGSTGARRPAAGEPPWEPLTTTTKAAGGTVPTGSHHHHRRHHPASGWLATVGACTPHTRAHTRTHTTIETTAFVSRACGVIMCYITTSALRAPVHHNGPDQNKYLAATLVSSRRRLDRREPAARFYSRVVEPVA